MTVRQRGRGVLARALALLVGAALVAAGLPTAPAVALAEGAGQVTASDAEGAPVSDDQSAEQRATGEAEAPAGEAEADAGEVGSGETDAGDAGPIVATDDTASAEGTGGSDEGSGESATSHPDAAWPSFRGASGGVTSALTPTVGSQLAWSAALGSSSDFHNRSDPLIVGGYLYVVVDAELCRIDLASGEVVARAGLAGKIDTTSRPVYDQETGLVMVPLHGGSVQALDVESLDVAWTTPVVAEDQQSLTTPLLADGRLYLGTTDSSGSSGHLLCVEVATGEILWDQRSQDAGYYWVGAVMTGRGLLVPDDAGRLTLRDPDTGSELARVDLGGAIRTTCALSEDGGTAYVVTRDDGTLHAVDVGTMQEVVAVPFCDYSTSTPTVVGTTAYVAGLVGTQGAVFAIDLSDLADPKVTSAIALGTGVTVGEVKSSPLVSVQGEATYVYFTANDANGALYVYRAGDDHFRLLFQPEEGQRQWCLASVVCDADGNLYYANDSSILFKLAPSDVETPQPELPQGESDEGKGGVSDGADGGVGSAPARGHAAQPETGTAPATEPVQGEPEAVVAEAGEGGATDAAPAEEGSATEPVADEATSAEDDASEGPHALPAWPIVGIVAGVVAIALVALWPWISRGGDVRHARAGGR